MEKKTKEDWTTIAVKKDTAKALLGLGKMGDTYDAVIRRLVNSRKPDEKEKPRGDE